MSLRGYVRKGRPALWKQAQDEADELSGALDVRLEVRRQEREAKRIAAHRASRVKAMLRQRNKPKAQKRIAPVSKHRAGVVKAYRRRVPKYLSENPHCVACARIKSIIPFTDDRQHKSESVHHKRGRLGPLLLDERYWLPTCIASHDWIHANISLARSLDLIAQPGQWNRPD